jgi:hypothetical protein
LFFY